jgi:hypothetical protein
LLTDAVAVEYEGPATLDRSGRGRLHDRVGGIGEMLWEALDRAGWVDEVVSIRTTVSLRVGVAAAPATRPKQRAQLEPLPGGVRRLGEKGWIDDQGVAWQQSVGPLNGRAAGPGYRLSASERRPEELEFGEDMLYTAAVRAGWLVGEPDEVADVPDVQITVSVARRNPSWEALGNSAAGSRDAGAASVTPTHSPDEDLPPRAAPTIGAIDDSELLALALGGGRPRWRPGSRADPARPRRPLRDHSHDRLDRVQRSPLLHRGDEGQLPGAQTTPALAPLHQ